MEDVIRTAVGDVLAELGLGEVDFAMEHPENLAFGDYACNAAMIAAKKSWGGTARTCFETEGGT